MYLYRVCWVRPYYALLLSLLLCVVTVGVSLLYLEDAALKLPHALSRAQVQVATPRHPPNPRLLATGQRREWGIAGAGAGAGVEAQRWLRSDHRKKGQAGLGGNDGVVAAGGGGGGGGGGSRNFPEGGGGEVKILNSLEILALNQTHLRGRYLMKESQRLGITHNQDGHIIIPPHLLRSSAVPPPKDKRRYIIYLCNGNVTCCGWGDRQHGVLSTYLISMVTDRVFGVDMSSPCPLTTLFHPRITDWKINSTQLEGLSSRHIYTVNDRVFRQVMQSIDFDGVYTEDIIYLTTNYDYFYALKANPHYTHLFRRKVHGKPRPIIFADLWQNIFKLNKRVRRRIDRAMKVARPTPHHKLICGHVRLGKNPSIPNDSEVRNTLQSIAPLWKFLAHFKDPKKYRFFVPTDSQLVRTKVMDMFPSQAVDIKGEIMHIDKTQMEDACVGFEKVLADQYLLSTCDVLVLTYSVFGKSAAYMRRSNKDLYFMENGTIKPLQLFKEKT